MISPPPPTSPRWAVHRVLVDRFEDGAATGRSFRQAPDIDGIITLDAGVVGTWVQAEMVASCGPDLAAREVVVLRSLLGRGEARYEPLERFPLG